MSNRKLKRREYFRLQRLYRSNRSKVLDSILNGNSISTSLTFDNVVDYWTKFLTTESRCEGVLDNNVPAPVDFSNLLNFISVEEVIKNYPQYKSAMGHDGVTVAMLRRIPSRALTKFYTAWLRAGLVPTHVLDSKTVFIPKGRGVDSPDELRPISISSVFLRHFHRILNNRLTSVLPFSPFQLGFQSMDGIARAVEELESVFHTAKTKYNPFSAVFIDFRKAFDSVAFEAIFEALRRLGVPEHFVSYIIFLYSNARTFLVLNGNVSQPIHPTRGVRQGDPLSSTLFLIVLDFVLRSLPVHLDALVRGSFRLSYVAYTGDILLLARDSNCLQKLLNILQMLLLPTGLSIN